MSIMPVVVGVDESPESLAAVELAATEAAIRGTGLRIVYAAGGSVGDAGPRIVAAAAARAAMKAPSVVTTHTVVAGSALDVLARESRGACVLVVGRRNRTLARIASTSVVAHIAARTACPVIVAQGVSEAATNILVGVSGTDPGGAALDFAFAEADLRRTGVTAIHAWRAPTLAGRGTAGGPGPDEKDAARVLSEALTGRRDRYPDVEVYRSVPESGAADALTQASVWAQMLVIGAPSGSFSPVVHEVVRRALCPVAIIPG